MSVLFIGCSNNEVKSINSTEQTIERVKSDEKPQQTQEELNNEIKSKAVKADFVKINAGEWKYKEVYIEGEISVEPIKEGMLSILPDMLITTVENDGFGVYNVLILDKSNIGILNKGTKVRIYGKCSKEESTGMPSVSGNVIEILGNVE